MFEKLKYTIAKFLHQRGILIENRSANSGGFGNLYDASLQNNSKVSDGFRRANLREGEPARPVPTAATVLQAPARQHGKHSVKDQHRRYLEDGWLED
jgi:hypothetical protein